jgi:hypothetical protein
MWQSDHSLQKTEGAEKAQAQACAERMSNDRYGKGGPDGPIEVKSNIPHSPRKTIPKTL